MLIIFLLYMLKPFNGSFSSMYMPFIGETSLLVILAIILFIVIVNGCFMLFTRNRVGINGLIGESILVDRHHLDEIENEEE